MKLNQKEHSNQAPRVASLTNVISRDANDQDKRSFVAQVPIDEVDAIGVKVGPTFARDTVESVTLKSFRKIVGYDTFNSILKKDRDEKKDESDYYNITVSLMMRRDPPTKNATPILVDNQALTAALDKGFPYDDPDVFSFGEHAKQPVKPDEKVKVAIAELHG